MSTEKNLVRSLSVEIAAPAELVWSILVDLPSYPQWNPYTVKVESSLRLGEPVNLFLPDPTRPAPASCCTWSSTWPTSNRTACSPGK